jgi:multimeric flavodoxin WrbA
MIKKSKILGVIGSPRKNGNTHILVSNILKAAEETGASAETILLADKKIEECDGCLVCWKNKECPKADDMLDLYPKIIESDVIIFGTPVYWYGPTAIMKSFLDRFVYFNCPENRNKIKGKNVVLVIPFEEETPATADLVVEMFKRSFNYLEMNLAESILIPGVSKRGDVLKKTECLKKCRELGSKILRF